MGMMGVLKSRRVNSFVFSARELDYILIKTRSYSDYLKSIMLTSSFMATAKVNVEIAERSVGGLRLRDMDAISCSMAFSFSLFIL